MKIIAQMDEIANFNINSDSTFAMLLEAQARGHEIFYYLPSELNFNVQNQEIFVEAKKILLQKKAGDFFKIAEKKQQNLTDFDVILVRQDPPFDMNYITTTYLLEKIKDKVLILNNPSAIRDSSEKIFPTDFPEICPPTLISCDIKEVKKFHQQHQEIILKPLYGRGGEGIILIKKDDLNLGSTFELLLKAYQTPIIAQKFLPEIKDGDKRIILVNGNVVGGIARVAENDTRSNLHVGGRAVKLNLSKRDLEICEIIGPELKKRGLFFVGIDVIGDYLTEINVTSPTGIPSINLLDGIRVEEIVIKEIEKMLEK
mgnify:CR=1 FL=1